MAIVTNSAHVDNALRFMNQKDSMYLSIGRSNTPWTVENTPPKEVPETTEITELTGMKKCDTVSLARKVRQDETPTGQVVEYEGEKWLLVNADQAHAEGANYVYIKATLKGAELPVGVYRQAGIQTGVKIRDGVTTTAVLPSEITDKGTLQFYANRPPMSRSVDILTIESWLVKF